MRIKTKLLGISLILLLQGCAAGYQQKFSTNDLLNDIPGTRTLSQQKQQTFTKYETAFLGKPVSYNARQQELLAHQVSFHSQEPVSLDTVLDTLAGQTRSSYSLNTKSLSSEGGGGGDSEGEDGEKIIKDNFVNFEGSFEEFIRYLSVLYDVNIKLMQDNILQVSVYQTYAINVDFFGKDSSYEASLDFSGNESTSSGGVTGKAESKFESTFWDDVEKMVETYVSSGVYNVFQDVGVVTISARPSEYATLSKVLNDFREINSKQFIITYKIYILDKNKTRTLDGEMGTTVNDSGTLFNFAGGGAGAGFNLSRNFFSGGGVSVTARLDALYRLTGSKILQSGTLVTRNNVPAPLNLTQSQNFVSGVTSTISNQIGALSSQVETSTIVTGTSVLITPRMLSDGRIALTSAFTKRNLNSIEVFPSGTGSGTDRVQLPNVSTTELFNNVDISPGELVVIGQYDLDESRDTRGLKILGGNLNLTDTTSTVVMIVGVDYYNKPFAGR